jgi:oxalate decarboxylase/phosphoglucose isomerase-like protein (cupin superfamily)
LRLGGDPVSGEGAATYQVQAGTVVYIPANTFHGIANDADHDLIFLTIWPQVTGPDANGIHDARVEAWGMAFRLQDGCKLQETEQGKYVTDASRGWNPLFAGQ